jgi:hypothetical protein
MPFNLKLTYVCETYKQPMTNKNLACNPRRTYFELQYVTFLIKLYYSILFHSSIHVGYFTVLRANTY